MKWVEWWPQKTDPCQIPGTCGCKPIRKGAWMMELGYRSSDDRSGDLRGGHKSNNKGPLRERRREVDRRPSSVRGRDWSPAAARSQKSHEGLSLEP